jgi:hypothetical protein
MRGNIAKKTKHSRKSPATRASTSQGTGRAWEGLLDPRDANQLEEIVNRALQLLNPTDEEKTECRERVKECMLFVRAIAAGISRNPSSAQIRDDFENLAAALRRAKKALDKLCETDCLLYLPMNDGDPWRSPLKAEWGQFYNALTAKLALLETRKNYVPKGSPLPDPAKRSAAWYSVYLIAVCGRKRPTKTLDGPFYELASLLYEGATYTAHANLERHCRRIFGGKGAPRFIYEPR